MTRHFLKSTAVMARRVEPADSLDFFPTPPWAVRAFLNTAADLIDFSSGPDAMDPCCGEGHMALVLEEYGFSRVYQSDIHDYGQPFQSDFLQLSLPCDWFFLNPPFSKALVFAERALSLARRGVAMLVRAGFLEGQERYSRLFAKVPPCRIYQYVERVPMHRGRYVVNGSTATSYCWLVWRKDGSAAAPSFHFIPPSKAKLFRQNDILRFGGCSDLPKTHPVMKGYAA